MRAIDIVGSVFLVVSACSRPLGPAPSSLAGTFDLVEINGQRLPIKRGPITDGAGRRTNCDLVLDQGRLSLNPERQRYELHYVIRSSCDGRILSDTGSLGSYTQVGSTLAFEIPSTDQPSEFRGSVSARAIAVQFYDQRMVFALRGSASALPLSGYFGTGDSVVVSAYPGMADSVVLLLGPSQHYETRFAPATGYFAVGREAVDVSGPYEQIGRVIYVEVNPAPGPIRVLRGLIVSETEIDVLRAGAVPQRFSKLDLPWQAPEPTQPPGPVGRAGPVQPPTEPAQPSQAQDPTQVVLSGIATDCIGDTPVRVRKLPVVAFDAAKNRKMLELLRTMDTAVGEDPEIWSRFFADYDRLLKIVDTSAPIARDTTTETGTFTLRIAPMDSVLVFGSDEMEDTPVYYQYAMVGGRRNAQLELDMSSGGCDSPNR